MWQAILQSAEIDWLRRDAERRLTQLRALDQMDNLQREVDRFAARAGHPPGGWSGSCGRVCFPARRFDPAGTPYELDAAGRVSLAKTSPLFPLPVEPGQNPARPPS